MKIICREACFFIKIIMPSWSCWENIIVKKQGLYAEIVHLKRFVIIYAHNELDPPVEPEDDNYLVAGILIMIKMKIRHGRKILCLY